MKTEGGGKKVQKKKEEMKGESKNARTVVVCVDVLLCCCFRGGDPAAIVLFLSRSSLSLSSLGPVYLCALATCSSWIILGNALWCACVCLVCTQHALFVVIGPRLLRPFFLKCLCAPPFYFCFFSSFYPFERCLRCVVFIIFFSTCAQTFLSAELRAALVGLCTDHA